MNEIMFRRITSGKRKTFTAEDGLIIAYERVRLDAQELSQKLDSKELSPEKFPYSLNDFLNESAWLNLKRLRKLIDQLKTQVAK